MNLNRAILTQRQVCVFKRERGRERERERDRERERKRKRKRDGGIISSAPIKTK